MTNELRMMRRSVPGTGLLKALALFGLFILMLTGGSGAKELALPSGKVILEVTGQITARNGDQGVTFDREMLEGLGLTVVETDTPWTDGLIRFEGVLMRDLLAAVGAQGDKVVATAINDYRIEIPMEDFEKHDVVLAIKRDGDYMRVRDKGPLWIIYPWSDRQELRNEVYHTRSIWQLDRIAVE